MKKSDASKGTFEHRLAIVTQLFRGDVAIRTLLERLTEGVIIVDDTGTIILVNQMAEKLFGYKQEEVVGQSLDIYLPEKYRDSHAGFVEIFFQNPWQRQMGRGIDLIGKRKDGTEFPIEVGLSYLKTSVGWMAIAFITDITQRKQIELELLERNEELDAFAHMVAHDVNASMSLVVGYSDALVNIYETLSPEELKKYLTLIARNGRKMSNIINELLLFVSMRKEDVPFRPLDMAAIVEEALRRLHYEIDAVDAEISLPESYPQVVGYAAWVEEVWFNYISNGLRYGGQPPRLELGSSLRDDGMVCFWVQDNGEGLSEEQQAAIFNPSSHTGVLRVQGHGLGLTIVQRIIEKLNGRVTVESQLGQGSRFGFILPVNQEGTNS